MRCPSSRRILWSPIVSLLGRNSPILGRDSGGGGRAIHPLWSVTLCVLYSGYVSEPGEEWFVCRRVPEHLRRSAGVPGTRTESSQDAWIVEPPNKLAHPPGGQTNYLIINSM